MPIKTAESGRSMLEMLGVIAIIGVITIGGISASSYIDSYFRTNSTFLDIENTAKDVADLYSWASDYSSLNMTTICNEDILECVDSSGSKVAKNIWGGTIVIASTGASKDAFTITYTKVPKSACQRLISLSNEKAYQLVSIESPTTVNGCAAGSNTDMVFKAY